MDDKKAKITIDEGGSNFREESIEFPSNSHKQKQSKKVQKIITGTATKQKKTFGRKVSETMLCDDTKSVASYIIYDVLVKAAKTMICDMIGWGGAAELMLFGEKRGQNTHRNGDKSYTSYGTFFKSGDRGSSGREISRTGRARHEFDEIVLETRGEAEEVLSHLVDLTIDYGVASVADLYDLVGINSNFTDNRYGWTDLRGANISGVRGGYLINLPRTHPID